MSPRRVAPFHGQVRFQQPLKELGGPFSPQSLELLFCFLGLSIAKTSLLDGSLETDALAFPFGRFVNPRGSSKTPQ